MLGTKPHSLHWTILELEDDSDDEDDSDESDDDVDEAMMLMEKEEKWLT